jgi:hypothetical protein
MTGGDVGALLGGWRKVADEDQRIVVCMKPATMVSGSLSRAKLAISKPRRHGASPGSAARHCSRLARPAGFKNELDAKFCGGLRHAG